MDMHVVLDTDTGTNLKKYFPAAALRIISVNDIIFDFLPLCTKNIRLFTLTKPDFYIRRRFHVQDKNDFIRLCSYYLSQGAIFLNLEQVISLYILFRTAFGKVLFSQFIRVDLSNLFDNTRLRRCVNPRGLVRVSSDCLINTNLIDASRVSDEHGGGDVFIKRFPIVITKNAMENVRHALCLNSEHYELFRKFDPCMQPVNYGEEFEFQIRLIQYGGYTNYYDYQLLQTYTHSFKPQLVISRKWRIYFICGNKFKLLVH